MELVLGGLVAGVALAALWAGATQRHLDRRERAHADWDGTDGQTRLWTTSARCPACARQGGLLEMHGQVPWFTCLGCGATHARETKA